ncbi:TRAM domain-containing protein [Candidatus Saccharibacteria bacterium]|nr:TRAM domain-containing protein [Candidatus Saccharibacteria bacterium]
MNIDIVILIAILVILAEVSFLCVKSFLKPRQKSGKRKVYIDSSTLMDGRILAVAETGFIGDDLIIPRSVIREMQLLADGKDSDKRSIARRGLDNVNALERVVYCNVEILQDALDRTPVDERLIALAKENHGVICTNDFNLNKVASAEGIDVLNINDLAIALQNEYQPGQKMKIKITAKGANAGQGVGHLKDGTMVIVDNGSRKVGQEVNVEVVRFIQTSSGRMLFTKRTK